MKALLALTIGVLTACTAGPPPTTPSAEQAQTEILAAEQQELAAWAARDVDAIMNAYTRDTLIMAAGAPKRDYAGARQAFERFLTDPGFALTFHSDPPIVSASADLGVATGGYELTYTNGETGAAEHVSGYHLLTWVKDDDGAWRIRRQLTGPAPATQQ